MIENKLEILTPKDEADWLLMRSKNLNSTEIAALFGISPYLTKFELWHRVKENITSDFQENERTQWGKRLESAIAQGVAEENGWHISPMKDYYQIPALRIGSSFDYSIDRQRLPYQKEISEAGILEIKNVDGLQFKNGWLENEEGELEAPLHIELQVQHQLYVSGRKFAYIAALVGGNSITLLKREADEAIQSRIAEEAKLFWESIDNNIEPDPDFRADAETISKLYGYASPGSVLDAMGNSELHSLAEQYKVCSAQAKEFEAQKDAIKSQVLMLIGEHEKVKGDNFSISAGITGPTMIAAHERKAFRAVRFYFKKEK